MMRKLALLLAQLLGLLWLCIWALLHLYEAVARPIPAMITAALILIALWRWKRSGRKFP